MAGDEIIIEVRGNLTADPELRFTGGGTPVSNFTVACTPRIHDRQNNQWSDGETTYLKCTAWRELAENVTESLVKGSRVTVSGKLITKKFTTRDGDQRSALEIDVTDVGASLRNATAKITKVTKNSTGQAQNGGQPQGQPQGGSQGGNQGGGQPQGGHDQSDPWGGGFSASDDPWAS